MLSRFLLFGSVDIQHFTIRKQIPQEEDYEALKDFKEIAAVYYPDFDT